MMERVIKCTEKLTLWLQMRHRPIRYFCYALDHSADKPMLCSTVQKTTVQEIWVKL